LRINREPYSMAWSTSNASNIDYGGATTDSNTIITCLERQCKLKHYIWKFDILMRRKHWFTWLYGGILNQYVFWISNVNSISVRTVTRSSDIDTRERNTLTIMYVYVRFWTVGDGEVMNTEIIAILESKHLQK